MHVAVHRGRLVPRAIGRTAVPAHREGLLLDRPTVAGLGETQPAGHRGERSTGQAGLTTQGTDQFAGGEVAHGPPPSELPGLDTHFLGDDVLAAVLHHRGGRAIGGDLSGLALAAAFVAQLAAPGAVSLRGRNTHPGLSRAPTSPTVSVGLVGALE